MISILLERLRRPVGIRRSAGTRGSLGVRKGYEINTPSTNPFAVGHINQRPTRRSLGLVGQQSRVRTNFKITRSVDELPPRLIKFIKNIIFPKYYNRKGTILSVDKMRMEAENLILLDDMRIIKTNDLLCFLYLNDLSYWYSFRDKKVYVYNHENNNFNNNPIHFKRWIPSFR